MMPKKPKKQNNVLILTDKEGEDNADAMLTSISELAYALPVSAGDKIDVMNNGTRSSRSRFFFLPSTSHADDAQRHKSNFKKKKVEHVDAAIQARVKIYKKKLPPELEANITKVREFFLKQIGPKTLASSAGSTQAKAVVQELLGTEVDSGTFNKFERMISIGVNISMARFITKYLDLPKDTAEQILAELNYKPHQMMPPQQIISPPQAATPQKRKRKLSSIPVMTAPTRRKEEK